jgi:hypothetical protein
MMGHSPSRNSYGISAGATIRPLHLAILLGASASAIVWGASLVLGMQQGASDRFALLLAAYALGLACFLASRARGGSLCLLDLPVFISLVGFAEFALAPLVLFHSHDWLEPARYVEPGLMTTALIYVLAGFVAFWIGASILPSPRLQAPHRAGRSNLDVEGENDTAVWLAIGLYGTAFVAKLYLLRNGLYFFDTSMERYYSKLASSQFFMAVAQLGTFALAVLAIEHYFHPRDGRRRLIFWSVFLSECGWGVVSGMKSELLQNFVVVALVSSFARGRLQKTWILAPVLGFVLLYPIFNNYRKLLRHDRTEASSATSVIADARRSVSQSLESGSGLDGWFASSARLSLLRLNVLQDVGLLLAVTSQGHSLESSARWWMIPFYPFIPRFVWPSKPVLDKGLQFSIRLGYGDQGSTAVSYPGDLYVTCGWAGLLFGMFLMGVVAQWLTNFLRRSFGKRSLSVYAVIFLTAVNIEIDAFSYWTGLIKWLAILSVLAWAVYGRQQPSRSGLTGCCTAQPRLFRNVSRIRPES